MINILGNGCTGKGWKFLLLNRPWNTLLKYTFVCFSILILYHSFTFLCSHKQHATVTSVEVLVNTRCFKKWRSFICLIGAPSFDNHYTHTVSRSAIKFQAEIRSALVLRAGSYVEDTFRSFIWTPRNLQVNKRAKNILDTLVYVKRFLNNGVTNR